MNFFSKSPKKSSSSLKKSPTTPNETSSHQEFTTDSPPPPLRKSHSSKSASSSSRKEKDDGRPTASKRNSRTFPKVTHSSSGKKNLIDPTEHPLNLPPELRRLSALSAMSDSDRMDIDSEAVNGAPSSPQPQQNIPGAFDSPKLNGRKDSTVNGAAEDQGPVPPPHKSNPTSPVPAAAPTPEDAEAFKTAGNKFYKAKEYKKAIEEYTKGMIVVRCGLRHLLIFWYSC